MAIPESLNMRGIFLRNSGSTSLQPIVDAFIEASQLKIHVQEVFLHQVETLVPRELREGSESWLLIFDAYRPHNVLFIAFPIYGYSSILSTQTGSISKEISDFLQMLGVDGLGPFTSFVNIDRYLEENLSPLYSNQYGLLRLQSPVTEFECLTLPKDFLLPPDVKMLKLAPDIAVGNSMPFLSRPSASNTSMPRAVRTISGTIQDPGVQIESARIETLSSMLSGGSTTEYAIAEMDRIIYQVSQRLAQTIRTETDLQPRLPPCVAEYEGILDGDTKQFLLTADTIHQFIDKHAVPDFDYSVAGVGLWKAVERELNLSIIWHLRRRDGIAGKDPFERSAYAKSKDVRYGRVKMNESDRSDKRKFRGIELGNIKDILYCAETNGAAAHIQDVLPKPWPDRLMSKQEQAMPALLNEVKDIRNRYAHITAMSREQYDQLRAKILGQDDKSFFCQILELRRVILGHWESSSLHSATQ